MLKAEFDYYDYEEVDIQADMREYFVDEVRAALGNRKFPLHLIAHNSNWRGQTGTAKVQDVEDMVQKCFSFDNNWLQLHKVGNKFYFTTANHDCPTGFTIDLKAIPSAKGYKKSFINYLERATND